MLFQFYSSRSAKQGIRWLAFPPLLLTLGLTLGLTFPLCAQPEPSYSGGLITLEGLVSGPDGTLPGAMVTFSTLSTSGGDALLWQTVTDLEGHFQFIGVPAGLGHIRILSSGYEALSFELALLENLTPLTFTLTPITHTLETVEVNAQSSSAAVNSMATVSARSFSKDDAARFAAAVNDPAKMALSFAGVKGTDDITGAIVIRGNSPKGVGWRVEGMEIPTPSHFSTEGAATGAVSMISNCLLTTSDFYTGAFPAEMGNAVSGVFDLRLRSGNPEERHYSIQASLLGLEASAEGPLNREQRSTYLINYRYSTIALLGKMGFTVGNTLTGYQDLNVKLEWPTRKAGVFSLFAIGGLSSVVLGPNGNQGIRETKAFTYGLTGLKHNIRISPKQHLTTMLAISLAQEDYDADASALRVPDPVVWTYYSANRTARISLRVDARLSESTQIRYGAVGSFFVFDLFEGRLRPPASGDWYWAADDEAFFGEAYVQMRHAINERLSAVAGLRANWFAYSNHANLEPRAALEWTPSEKETLTLAAGIHSRLESMAYYMARLESPDLTWQPNRNLDYGKASHVVLGYTVRHSPNLSFHVEGYIQYLYQIPVAGDTTGLSAENEAASPYFSAINYAWRYPEIILKNEGHGLNYGIEITVERRFEAGWYMLLNGSLFRSLFTASDGIWRPSTWDAGFITNATAGRDFKVGRNSTNTAGINGRILWSGGYRVEETLFQERLPAYFRTDIRLHYHHAGNHPWTLSLDIQNLTNRLNANLIDDIDPIGLIPVLGYQQSF